MNVENLTTMTLRRELAYRAGDGLEITLYWSPDDNGTTVEVHHRATGETIGFPVAADRALDAFHHPFAHLAEQSTVPRASDSNAKTLMQTPRRN
jgi:hypothetical protein